MPKKIKGPERVYYSSTYKNGFKNRDYVIRNYTYYGFAIKAPASEIPNLLNTNIYGKPTVNFGSNPTRFRNTSHEKETRKEFNAYRFQAHLWKRAAQLTWKAKNSKNKATRMNAVTQLKPIMDTLFNNRLKHIVNKGISKTPTGKFFGKLLNRAPLKERLAIENEILQGALTAEVLDELQLLRTQWEQEYLEKQKQYEDGEITNGEKYKGFDKIRDKYKSKINKVLNGDDTAPFENGFNMPKAAFANWVKNYLSKTTTKVINGQKYRVLKKDAARFDQLKKQLTKTEKGYQEAFQMRKTVDQIYKEGYNDILLDNTLKFQAEINFNIQEARLSLLKDNLKGIQSAAAEEAGEAISINDYLLLVALA